MKLYKIKDWNSNYETHKTRILKKMEWVAIPNRFDGDGYTALMEMEDGWQHFGIWILLLQIASKCKPRGVLQRDNGKPHTPESISRMTGAPEGAVYLALRALSSEEVGWVESEGFDEAEIVEHHNPAVEAAVEAAAYPAVEAATYGMEWNGMEGKVGKECTPVASLPESAQPNPEKGRTKGEPSPAFIKFWELYPSHRRADRKGCWEKWRKNKLERLAPKIQTSLALWVDSAEWAREGGKFIPLSTTWINQQRWESTPSGHTEPAFDPDNFNPVDNTARVEQLVKEGVI